MALLQVGSFVTKVVAMVWFLMLIRWTLPRFRYDQAMRLGWLGLLPLAVLNIILTAAVLLLWGGDARGDRTLRPPRPRRSCTSAGRCRATRASASTSRRCSSGSA